MSTLTKKQERLYKLAEKGGNNSDLVLLEEVESIEEKLDTHIEEMREEITSLETEIKETKEELKQEIKESIPDLNKVLESIKGKDGKDGMDSTILGPQGERGEKGDTIIGPAGRDGKDGMDGLNGHNGKDGVDGKDGQSTDETKILSTLEQRLPELGERVRDGLALLQGDNRLDVKAIKGLEEEIKKLRDSLSNIPRGKMGMRKVPIIKRHNLTSQTDGVTKAFTLPPDTVDVLGVFGTQFPINFNPGVDWTFSGRTLTLGDSVSAPDTGQSLYCLIEVLFY